MRVALILEQCLNRVPGGTGRYTREMAKAIAVGNDSASTVTGWTAAHRNVDAARIAPLQGPRSLGLPRRALAAAWERGAGPAPRAADIIHAPTLLAPPRRSVPLVVTIHDAVPWTHPEALTLRGRNWHRRMGERVAGSADAVVVPTRAVAAELSQHLELGGRVHVVGEGVSLELAEPPDADARIAAMALPEKYFALVGTVEPRKGIDIALDALAMLSAPRLPLVLVGPQ